MPGTGTGLAAYTCAMLPVMAEAVAVPTRAGPRRLLTGPAAAPRPVSPMRTVEAIIGFASAAGSRHGLRVGKEPVE